MHKKRLIKNVGEILAETKSQIPAEPGIYAFWWMCPKEALLAGRRHIILKGPKGGPVDVYYEDWWPPELDFPCLYVGKSTNIRRRFSQHLLQKSTCRIHAFGVDNSKIKPHNTTCQLRHGIEHVFSEETEPMELIKKCVGFSYQTEFPENPVAERFFEEDRLIGTWRPWFNVDSER